MKSLLTALALSMILCSAAVSYAHTYDAVDEFSCESAVSEAWSYEGYRAADKSYLTMDVGRAPLTEVTKYGVDAYYIPDSGQPYYPFITRFPDGLWMSPATRGDRFDAVLSWNSHKDQNARLTGTVTLKGNLEGQSEGKKIRAELVRGGETLWSADITGGQTAAFDVASDAKSGDKYRLHIINAGDSSGNMALVSMKVETPGQ